MTKPNKKQLDQIKGSLEDNAGDMTRSDLWEYIRDEWHTDNYESDDKEKNGTSIRQNNDARIIRIISGRTSGRTLDFW